MSTPVNRVIYRVHAIRRMFERGISGSDVLDVLNRGIEIESYSLDTPYPSRLLLGFIGDLPLHVVAAYDSLENQTIVVTVYRPDSERWSADFRSRKKK